MAIRIERIAPWLAVAPYAGIAIVLHELPLAWPAAIGNAALLLVGLLDGALAVAALAFPLAGSSWLVHRRLVRRGYHVAENVLQLGATLLSLAVVLVVAVP